MNVRTDMLPPGPRGVPGLGILPLYSRDPLGTMLRAAREYGDVVTLPFGHRRAFLVSRPEFVDQILVADAANYTKGQALQRSEMVFGKGLLTSEGVFWRRQRRMIQPAFQRDRIAAQASTMVDCTRRRMGTWSDGGAIDIGAEMMMLTLDIASRTLFSTEIAEMGQVAEAIDVAQSHFARWMRYVLLLPMWVPTPQPPKLKRAVRALDDVIYRLIRERRASGEERDDLLGRLLRAQDEDDGHRMTDRQVRDEAMTMFLAGHDTTAHALTWTLVLLARRPDVEAKMLTAIDRALHGRQPIAEDRPALRYVEQVVMEAMRLYPPAYAVGRMSLKESEVGGYRLPAGSTAIMSQWVIHRDASLFPDPERFDPDRWAADLGRSLPRGAYFPFGGGPRICIGQVFAMQEAVLLLAAIAPHYSLRLSPPDQRIELQPAVTLRPRGGIQMQVCQR